MKKILFLVKRVILSTFVLYGYNIIASSFNQVIPINIITITLVSFLGVPALFALILLKVTSF